ncbi:MAG: 2'-5' RNA ligase family protein [bacterium]|nr:2'-5' RNA ligase family protein [bacterium]
MDKQKTGYIAVYFADKEKNLVRDWSKIIQDRDFYFISKKEKIDGGNVTDDLHLTLFYGFNEELVYKKDDIQDFIDSMNLENIEIDKVGVFSPMDQEYKVLYLSVKDKENNIKKYHEELKKFPHFAEFQKFEYVPHITVAFVKKDFDTSKIAYNGPQFLRVKKAIYHVKNKD